MTNAKTAALVAEVERLTKELAEASTKALEYAGKYSDIVQAITDPENQPSQYGTVTLKHALDLCKKERRKSRLYTELLLSVESKFPGENRHETALRYIRSAEHGRLVSCTAKAVLDSPAPASRT